MTSDPGAGRSARRQRLARAAAHLRAAGSAVRATGADAIGRVEARLDERSALTRYRQRRQAIGPEGRLAEDVVRAVRACQPIWELLQEKGISEDLSLGELDSIHEGLLGRSVRTGDAILDVSIKLAGDAFRARSVRAAIPAAADVEEFDAYRYATLTELQSGRVEPFIVALQTNSQLTNDVVSTMFVDSSFLRYEQEFGVIDTEAVALLSMIVLADLVDLRRTEAALRRA